MIATWPVKADKASKPAQDLQGKQNLHKVSSAPVTPEANAKDLDRKEIAAEASKDSSSEKGLSFDGVMKVLTSWSLNLARVTNALSCFSFFSKLVSKNSAANPLFQSFEKLGSFFVKNFYVVNSIKGSLSRIKNQDWLAGLGHVWDVIASFIFKKSDLFLMRGISVGMYMFANGVKDALRINKFAGFKDHWNKVLEAVKLGKGFAGKDFVANFMSTKTGLQSMIAGTLLFLGPIVAKLTGSRILGGSVRDTGAITQDTSQVKREFILTKEERNLKFTDQARIIVERLIGSKKAEPGMRPNYYKSGIFYIINTACDWIGKALEKMGAPRPLVDLFESGLCYQFDMEGVYKQVQAQDEEVGLKFA